jgi:soluble lytic murein transglycosylase-like protein
LIHANPYHRFVSNPAVIHRIEKERQDHPINKRTWLNEQYFASIAYKSEIDLIGKNLGIDPLLLLAILKAESGFNPNAVSSVGARGIMQIMPYTAVKLSQRLEDSEFTLENLNSPIKSILYGTTYLSMLNRAFKNNMIATIAAYNAGPSVVQQWIMHCKTCRADEFVELIPFRETRNYVKKVLSYYTDFTDKLDKTPDLGHLQDLPKVTPDDLSGLF